MSRGRALREQQGVTDSAEYSWVAADGALRSGDLVELASAARAGRIPPSHPVWRHGWSEWVPFADAALHLALPSATPAFQALAPLDAETTLDDLTLPRAPKLPAAEPAPMVGSPLPPETTPWPPDGRAPSEPPPVVAPTLPPAPRAGASTAHAAWPVLVGLALAVGGAALGAGIVASGLGAHTALARSLPAVRASAPLALPATELAAPVTSCRRVGSKVELSSQVRVGSPIEAAFGSDARLAVGVATGEKSGLGLALSPSPLAIVGRSRLVDATRVSAVVPSTGSDGPAFVADRFARSLPGTSSLRVGMTPAGFARIGEDGATTTLWRGQAAEIISRPSVAHVPGGGWAVAFRRGEARSTLRFGWLTADGERQSELGVVSVASGRVGIPAVAVGESRVLTAYAIQQPATAPWSIDLFDVLPGELPRNTVRLDSSSTRDQRLPSVAPLPGGRWLVVWVEGDRRSGRNVRAMTLSRALRPDGEPVLVHADAGVVDATAAVARGGTAVVLFSERQSRARSLLSAVSLDCR